MESDLSKDFWALQGIARCIASHSPSNWVISNWLLLIPWTPLRALHMLTALTRRIGGTGP
jgi:hypothetical protein